MNDPTSKIFRHIESFLSDRKNKKIVFTNGCFDLLHEGHLHLLREAKKLGDILIVAVNDDASVKRLKGEKRPVENLETRMKKLSQLNVVDAVISFDEDTPLELIQKIEPDILVKGNDYKEEDVVGGELVKKCGGKVVLIPLLDGFSTTASLK
ncbi:MAG: rfaE bifunctional protein [Bacteroidota bacterium]|nr:rfaE bifunctional protein [Bacteroidota bacterium]